MTTKERKFLFNLPRPAVVLISLFNRSLFSLGSLNVTSDQDFSTYLSDNYLHGTSPAEAEKLASLYPSDPISGSPFDTGILNILTPQFKRLAAVQGDLVFQAPRRFFLSQIASQQDAWTYSEYPPLAESSVPD